MKHIYWSLFSLLFSISTLTAASETPAKETLSLVGYWAPDEQTLLKQFLSDRDQNQESDEIERKRLTAKAKRLSQSVILHYRADLSTSMYSARGKMDSTYKIIATRTKAKELDVDVISKDFGTEQGTARFHGKLVTMLSRTEQQEGAPQATFKKLTKKEAEKQIALITGKHKAAKPAVAQKKPAENKPVLLDKPLSELTKQHPGRNLIIMFKADWCVTCVIMEKHLSSPKISKLLKDKNALLVYADCTQNDSLGSKEFIKQKGQKSLPYMILIDQKGTQSLPQVSEYLKPEALIKLLNKTFNHPD